MQRELQIYNTLTRKKEEFKPLQPPFVGLYACGPTVYGDAHLGHARQAVTFDLIYRYLKHLEYKVRYVRNITDVGHLENDADEGEDKIAKKARMEQVEPMEVVQYYTERYHTFINMLNCLSPNIEPRATGHILEQQAMIEQIMENGFAYERNGSVYFDIEAYNKKYNYGKLSGRVLEDLMTNTRNLDGQTDKKHPFDFALWKKASPEHIMRWRSEWSDGFPGWHLECSAMSTKYLGEQFDIHGGGMDLMFPHHECEIAQTVAANGKEAVKYWMHNNMITINGQKMSKSLGNFITLDALFTGEHDILEQAYSPMTIRFFILQSHYRNPVDFSNASLQAAEKGLQRIMTAIEILNRIKPGTGNGYDANSLKQKCYAAINDDFNSPVLIAHLFDAVKTINTIQSGNQEIDKENLEILKETMHKFVFDILGLIREEASSDTDERLQKVIDAVLNLRMELKANKDYATADKIRDTLTDTGLVIKDKKDGFEWEFSK